MDLCILGHASIAMHLLIIQYSCCLTLADLPSHWYLDRYGREALKNFELLLKIQDQKLKNQKPIERACPYLGLSISTTLGKI
jgi:hypothetical protein